MVELLAELLPGDEFGPYLVEALTAASGSSFVYRSVHVPTGERVAIKMGRSADEGLYRRLRREAALLESVDHPHIVGLRQAGVRGDRPFLVTDWVEGPTLADVIADEGHLSVETALDVARVVAGSLDHLHRLGVVHRELSPASVRLEGGARPMLTDLGAVPVDRSAAVVAVDAGAELARYAAPEVITGDVVDGRADQYSLAAMIHEIVTGGSPFPAADRAAIGRRRRLDDVPQPLSEVDPAIPGPVEEAVLRGLAKDPDDRFESCADLVLSATERSPAAGGAGTAESAGNGGPVSGVRRRVSRLLRLPDPGTTR